MLPAEETINPPFNPKRLNVDFMAFFLPFRFQKSRVIKAIISVTFWKDSLVKHPQVYTDFNN